MFTKCRRRRRSLVASFIALGCFWIAATKRVASGFSSSSKINLPPPPMLPTDPESMLRQATSAISGAFRDGGIHRQTIRLPLSESMYASREESFVADRAIGWRGGPRETYRYVSPMARDLLREVVSERGSDVTGLAPRLQEQVLLDFDGSSLWNAQSPLGARNDGIALVQPGTDRYYTDFIEKLERDFSDIPNAKAKRLFLLVNPSWKDANSWGYFQRKYANERILSRYETTYAIDQFIVRGNKLSLLKAWPCDWCVYYTPLAKPGSLDAPAPRLLGTFSERPLYAQIDELVLRTS